MPTKTKTFLVVGCGSIGQRHIGNLLALQAGAVIGCDTQEARRRETAAKFGIRCYAALEAAWKCQPDVVVVTLPTHLHLPAALAAAKRGCHIFIEKPLADRLPGTRRLIAEAQKQKLVTLVGCNMRFHPGIATLKRLLTQGVVGRICSARAEVGQYLPDWHPLEDYRKNYSARRAMGGGIILDAIHEIDYLRWLMGEVISLSCFAGKISRLEIETEDMAVMLLRFQNGAIGEVHLDYVQRAYHRSCRIVGDEGTLHWDYTAGRVNWYSAAAKHWRVIKNPPGWEPNQMYVDELKHFLACLDGRETSVLDVAEARQVLQIALAAKQASKTKRIISWS